MTTTESTPRRRPRRLATALALLAALCAASCGDQEKQQSFDFEKPPEFDRGLNQTEIDSLRAMKITHRVVRDEYWDMQGGVIANDRLEVWYSDRKIYVLQAMAVLKQMDQVADQIRKSFGTLPAVKLVVVCAPNLDTFRRVTGRDWWHYALIKGDTLSVQTPMTLYMRGLLNVAARREYSRWALGHFTQGEGPRWVTWGMAAYLGGERDVLRGQRKEYAKLPVRMPIDDVEKQLRGENDRLEFRRALYNAYLMVNELVETHGMPSVAAFIMALPDAPDANAAAQRAFNKSYDEILSDAQAWKEPETP